MRFRSAIKSNTDGLFSLLLVLTGFFILLEFSFFIQCARVYLSDFEVVSNQLAIPAAILPGILYFIAAELLLHFVYCVFIWVVARSLANLYEMTREKTTSLAVYMWVLGIVTILVANQYYYPNSAFSDLMSIILPYPSLVLIALVLLLLVWIIALTLVLINIIASMNNKTLIVSAVFVLAVTAFYSRQIHQPVTTDAATTDRPDIILIGMDSLRPDFLGFFGNERTTPFLDAFLNQSAVFSEAVTPLARTFPSWTGILSGRYPLETGIRFNLARQDHADFSMTLPALLQRQGYKTVYATDETRFSNISKNYGFDQIVSPPVGLDDFLVGTFNDFPLSNLVLNTTAGKWLFPYSYGNRPVAATYEPNSFLNMLKPVVTEQRHKPLFLAVHFCLAHFPYHWAGLSARGINVQQRYSASVNRLDRQVADFYTMLKQNHLLDHAIVVLLSDHGEALELNGDRITDKDLFVTSSKNKTVPKFYPPGLEAEKINQSGGHGTDVLGLPQYHSLLVFRLYGVEGQARVVPGVVSLLDIKPTILDLLHLPVTASSGISLASYITQQHAKPLRARHIFLESDFSPEAIRTVYPDMRKAMLEGIDLFHIDPVTTKLLVKDSMSHMIISSKQYADIYGDWMLALYPQNNNYRMPILVNLSNGEWTNDLHSSFAVHSPAQEMLHKLKAFYGNEIDQLL